MMSKKNVLVVDPTPYPGGSKFATENILKLLDTEKFEITVISADSSSWRWGEIRSIALFQPKWIADYEMGLLYFLRHFFVFMQILYVHLFIKRCDVALGASGPGVDLAIYMAKPLIRYNIIQLIHGPIATSNTIRRCLNLANQVHYLKSTESSILRCMALCSARDLSKNKYHILCNGLPDKNWPSQCQSSSPVIFWAASLLKWKGISLLIDALEELNDDNRPETNICYIRPKNTAMPISDAPKTLHGVHWHEQPEHLNDIRSRSNIFVSTSQNEPFGLSILEAMAAGHCVVIPRDGAFWDSTLEDGKNCVKYEPQNPKALSKILLKLSEDFDNTLTIGREAAVSAKHYRASLHYAPIIKIIEDYTLTSSKPANDLDGKVT